ncbi:MAG: S9 family peptidase [Bacteroidales bacterium]
MKILQQIVLSVVMITTSFTLSRQVTNKITLEDIWSGSKYNPKTVKGITSFKNGDTYSMLNDSLLNIYKYETGELVNTLLNINTLIPEGSTTPIQLNSFSFSNDDQKLLIATETEAIYRRSSKSNYFCYNLANKKLFQVSENGKQQSATFSPDGNMIAFVRDNNLYIKHIQDSKEEQITHDGEINTIINGSTDWVYEEEFEVTQAFFWSADSRKIAFYRFDESAVKEYQLEIYNGLYPELYRYKYPKAGENISKVDILVYHLDTKQSIRMETGSENDQYLPRVKWSEDLGKLAIVRMNRLQNSLEILLSDVSTGSYKVIYTENNPRYIEINDNLHFLPNKKQFILTSEKSGFNHIYLYNINGSEEKQLTSGDWEVSKVYGINPVDFSVYFQSTKTSPIDRQVFKVNMKGKITQLTNYAGTNDAFFNSNFSYFINQNSTANTPYYTSLNQEDGKEISILEKNEEYMEMLSGLKLSKLEFFEISDPSFVLPNGEDIKLNAWKILPSDFDSTKKYPVLFYVYGGPGSQIVTNSWGRQNFLWFQMLAQKGVIVVSVDVRGTAARGEQFKKMTYLELGKYETEDVINCARFMRNLPYVDSTRIGIFGWSYGGYISSLAITKGADYFTSAIAVAPVINWRNYDNIYTERYMQRPMENASGYDENSPVNYIHKLKGNLLLVHGSADDNVHIQNSMEFINAMIKANKQFELLIYPNRKHGISGDNARLHLYEAMTRFIDKNLLNK